MVRVCGWPGGKNWDMVWGEASWPSFSSLVVSNFRQSLNQRELRMEGGRGADRGS